MSVTRLVLPGAALAPGEVLVPPAVAKHARVTRVAPGEPIELLDLDGAVAVGRLLRWEGGACRVAVDRVERERGEPAAPVVLGVGILHTAAFDWLVEKATELGATTVVPLLTARVQGRRHDARIERWRRIAEAAVAQCGRSRPPTIADPHPLEAFLAGAAGLCLLAEEGAPVPEPAAASAAGVTLLVGPEGGLLDGEIVAAHRAGFVGLPLGPRTLRAETAALAILAVAQHLAAHSHSLVRPTAAAG
jgi:16S rRNA (uracil1498-N3)-methyltransferase